jgi:hypothetical protein
MIIAFIVVSRTHSSRIAVALIACLSVPGLLPNASSEIAAKATPSSSFGCTTDRHAGLGSVLAAKRDDRSHSGQGLSTK